MHCTACGACCNTAPLLSLPELFHHQHRFIGTLGIRRIKQICLGDRLGRDSDGYWAGAEDCAGYEQISRDCLYRIRAGQAENHDILLALQGFEDPDLSRCPILDQDGRCAVHDDRKPAACAVVPLDAFMPDRLQHLVLSERCRDSEDLGARCIKRKANTETGLMVQGPVVMDGKASNELSIRRCDMAADKRYWGEAVFKLLENELFLDSSGLLQIPTQGFLTLSMAPVLMVLAKVSEACWDRCLAYLDAQLVLCESTMRATMKRKTTHGSETLDRLRAFMRTSHTLRSALLTGQGPQDEPSQGKPAAAAVEAWLGLARHPSSSPTGTETRSPT